VYGGWALGGIDAWLIADPLVRLWILILGGRLALRGPGGGVLGMGVTLCPCDMVEDFTGITL